MAFHTGQTFTFGEQPSATKWQYLWDNDYALADGSGIEDDAILGRHIAEAEITGSKIAPGAILLGFKSTQASNQALSSNTMVNLSSDTYLEVTIPPGGRSLRISALVSLSNSTGSAAATGVQLRDGGAGGGSPSTSSTELSSASNSVANGFRAQHYIEHVLSTPDAGVRRFGISAGSISGWTVTNASSPGWIMVELV